MRRIIALACMLIAAGAFGAEVATTAPSVSNWHIKNSPHFKILHESVWSPSSISLEMEKMYSSIRLNMAMFAPWMVKEKTKIYIYSSQSSYVNGEFNPPPWSKGLAYVSKKTVVVYDTGDIQKLKAVISHELTHLYFESYFSEKLKYPPQWLNEGLAVYLEESVFPSGGPWSNALAYFTPGRRVPFDIFFDLKIDQLDSDAKIADWYLQAYGTVLYLYRPHTRVQFKALCDALRSGEKLEVALWKGYRIREGGDFGVKWSAWLDNYSKPDRNGVPMGSRSASFNFKPVQLSSFSFTNFGSKK
ncbi:MAG: hypothetical protein COX65_06130 [Elusimicrobia bacterium CG_4_10_14_0_2_um_filter_56_8]|nr:MAG: hypothetical protein COX65_06130 [Elusimicrobia bacterium CG_4_10_14_0_2_um_filter_56_8]